MHLWLPLPGRGATTRLHKESHQILDLVNLFEPITKYSTQIREPEITAEIVRKAFKTAENEKPGCSFIDFPENIAAMQVPEGMKPLKKQFATEPVAPRGKCTVAAQYIRKAKAPVIMVGNAVIRSKASKAVVDFAEKLNIPVATTFMAKGVMPSSHALSLGAIGLKGKDYVSFGFEAADLIICIGVDMVEYHPELWNPNMDKKILHIDLRPAEVDEHYILECGILGDMNDSLERIGMKIKEPKPDSKIHKLIPIIKAEWAEHKDDTSFPIKPQKNSLGFTPGTGPRRYRGSPMWVLTRCGSVVCIRQKHQIPALFPMVLRQWVLPCQVLSLRK